MCRNSDIAELKATSSKSLIDKLKMFEINQRKLAKSWQNYGMQEVTSPNKEADLPCLGAVQDKGDKGDLGTKRKKKHVSRVAAVDYGRELTATQGNLKAHEGVNKPVPKLDEIHNQGDLTANQSKLKKCDVATKKLKTYVTKKLDFSHLRSTFDKIGCRVKTMSERVGEQQNTPTQQPENLESNHVPHDEPSAQGLNNSASVGRAANHGLKRKLDATPKWNNIVPATNALQEPSSANSAQITRNIDQQNNTQVNCERVRETQDEFPLSSSEREVPQADEGILEQEGSRKGKSKVVLRASTIDEFLKENGIEMELEGLIQDGLSTEPQSDVGETLALDKDYSPHVIADIVVDEGDTRKKKKTRGNTTCNDIYGRTLEQRDETKFILLENIEKWVVQSVRDAWKRFKGKIKQKHFLPYYNVENM
ncbi:hypothetical protein PIB30_077378 [Stylosanthes scabra]|uniref:Uncharacterized protein n=1 Tax=Stylosanthes scabra TaxID=79078 RepID=A0ABU6SQZ5_9FABA|nr:hypothetical protein [Stylosanthes scabra]